MSEPRKHHYLPQFYLAHFADAKERFWQYEKTADAKHYGVSIADAAAIKDFHKLDYKDAQDPNALEKGLAKVEDYLSRNLNELLGSKTITKELRPALVELASILRFRVPSVKDFIEELLEDSVKGSMELMKLNGKLPDLEKLEAEVGKDNIEVTIANWMILRHMYALALDEQLLNILYSMKISLCEAPEGSQFITSDQPVSFFHPNTDADSFYGIPFIDHESELVLPLSNKLAAKFAWNGKDETRVLSAKEVSELNRRAVIMAQRYIFSSDEEKEISDLISQYHKFNAGFETDMLKAGDAFYQVSKVRCVMPADKYSNR